MNQASRGTSSNRLWSRVTLHVLNVERSIYQILTPRLGDGIFSLVLQTTCAHRLWLSSLAIFQGFRWVEATVAAMSKRPRRAGRPAIKNRDSVVLAAPYYYEPVRLLPFLTRA